jgi:hypothetical protein
MYLAVKGCGRIGLLFNLPHRCHYGNKIGHGIILASMDVQRMLTEILLIRSC